MGAASVAIKNSCAGVASECSRGAAGLRLAGTGVRHGGGWIQPAGAGTSRA